MKKTLLSFLSAAMLLGTQSCKDDIDIFAQGEEVTVVYGLLNAKDSLQSIKINRVFQGQGSLEELAQDPSNSEYENLDSARLIEFEVFAGDTRPTGNEWPLFEDIVTNKDSGFFYYPDQKIYRAAADLKTDKYYQLYVDKQNGQPIVNSFSEVIEPRDGKSTMLKPVGVHLEIRGLSLSSNGEEPKEDDLVLEFDMPLNAKVMEVYMDFFYQDQYWDSSFSDVKTLTYKVGTLVAPKIKKFPTDVVVVEGRLNATSWYNFIASNVSVLDASGDIRQRVPANIPIKFRYIVGGQELQTYMEVSAPSTSLLENKPEYTNVENGIGVFSCRSFEEMDGYLTKNTIKYLVEGEITAGRGFCHSTDPFSGSYCY